MTSILVLDANQRSALAITRSLGRHPELTVFTADALPEALAGASRFSRGYFQLPPVSEDLPAFLKALRQCIDQQGIDVVFAPTEVSSQAILHNPDCLGRATLPFASLEQVMQLADKGKLVQLAQQLQVPLPASRWFAAAGDCVPTQLDLNYPLIVKPTLSRILTDNGWVHTSVHRVDSRAELEQLLQDTDYLQHPFMLQQFIPGTGAGIFALYDQGQPVAFFSHQRLREKPPGGGVSVLSASRACTPQLLQQAKAILDAANWHGVAMVEFRVSDDGTGYLMEVNTRFWGSLQLAIDAGVDFPWLLYQVHSGQAPAVVGNYREGQRLRWLLGDLDSLYLVLRNKEFPLKEKLTRLGCFFLPRPWSTRHEVNRWGDLKPAWVELKQYFQALRS